MGKISGNELPKKITVCRSSGKVLVACCSIQPEIKVLDGELNELFCCQTGPEIGFFGTFTICLDAKFDECGNIIVSNSYNKSIYIFGSQNGQWKRTIESEISHFKGKLRCIAPTPNGSLYACIDDQIITIKYLE